MSMSSGAQGEVENRLERVKAARVIPHYSLQEGAHVLGVTERTLKARLTRVGITPVVDPVDHRRLLITEMQLKRLGALGRRADPVGRTTPLRKVMDALQGLLLWRKQTDLRLAEYGAAVAALSDQVHRLDMLTNVAMHKLERVEAASASGDMHERVRRYLQPIIRDIEAVATQLEDRSTEARNRLAELDASGQDAMLKRGARDMRGDQQELESLIGRVQKQLFHLNSALESRSKFMPIEQFETTDN